MRVTVCLDARQCCCCCRWIEGVRAKEESDEDVDREGDRVDRAQGEEGSEVWRRLVNTLLLLLLLLLLLWWWRDAREAEREADSCAAGAEPTSSRADRWRSETAAEEEEEWVVWVRRGNIVCVCRRRTDTREGKGRG